MKKTPGPKTAGDRAMVDELARLEAGIAVAQAQCGKQIMEAQQKAAALRAKILGWYDKAGASASFVAQGDKAAYAISARALKTTVFVDKALAVLGMAKFMKLATVPVGVLKKAAGKKYKLCANAERVGLRSLTQVGS
ncbi:MAG TPA: hypothetical protein VK752_05275 [Bryobacteraceae bacterium]|jgi:hypothetical protein|nr:hypothetical protein [Bryobacteraceae bacterium]